MEQPMMRTGTQMLAGELEVAAVELVEFISGEDMLAVVRYTPARVSAAHVAH